MMEEFENNVLRTEHLPQIHSEEFEKLPIRYRNIRWATCGLVALGVLLIFVALMVGVSVFEPETMDLNLLVVPTALWLIVFGMWGLSEWFGF